MFYVVRYVWFLFYVLAILFTTYFLCTLCCRNWKWNQKQRKLTVKKIKVMNMHNRRDYDAKFIYQEGEKSKV